MELHNPLCQESLFPKEGWIKAPTRTLPLPCSIEDNLRKRALIPESLPDSKRLKTAVFDQPVSLASTVHTRTKRRIEEQPEVLSQLKRSCVKLYIEEPSRKRKELSCDTSMTTQYNQQGEKIVSRKQKRRKAKKAKKDNDKSVNIQSPAPTTPTTVQTPAKEEAPSQYNDYNWWKPDLPPLHHDDMEF